MVDREPQPTNGIQFREVPIHQLVELLVSVIHRQHSRLRAPIIMQYSYPKVQVDVQLPIRQMHKLLW